MKKIFNYYILSAKEMDEIQYTIDWYHKYKILAELEWKSDEKDAETPEYSCRFHRHMDSTSHIFLRKSTDSSGNNKTGILYDSCSVRMDHVKQPMEHRM